jgi:predicted TPR repeat methyltransferase
VIEPAITLEKNAGVAELLRAAASALRSGKTRAAEEQLGRALAIDAEHVEALHALAMLWHRDGRSLDAQALMRRALLCEPRNVGIRVNLANMLFEAGNAEGAIAAYRDALAIEPALAQVWCNLGTVARRCGKVGDARLAWSEAVRLSPDNAAAWYGLATTLIAASRIDEALHAYEHAKSLPTTTWLARERFIVELLEFGRSDEAERLYRAWLAEAPDGARSCLQLAATLAPQAPERASGVYVEELFERFAPSFDNRLAMLDYKAPHLVARSLAACRPDGTLDIADLGCGTGLCGPLLRPQAVTLVGCDLSGAMLERARARECYDALLKIDLEQFLHDRTSSFDALVSADTLCYFGALETVFHAAARSLRDAGCFVFSLEALYDDVAPWTLATTGRYRHARSYVVNALQSAGFMHIGVEPVVLRLELGEPVDGWLVTVRL